MPAGSDLVYYPDSRPGIARRRHGRGFTYVAPDGTTIAAAAERARLQAMAVPPAYERVWMCPLGNGHLMATGFDARERKQYRYHPDWSAAQSEAKFGAMAAFGVALPRIREGIARDLRRAPGGESFALAAAALLIDEMAVRVGNASYAAENGSYGATTLKRRHLRLTDSGLQLRWTAKGGQKVRQRVQGRRLMRALQTARDLPGADLFSWVDETGTPRSITSHGLNDYLAALGGGPFTAKVFRTWAGSLAAFEAHLADPDAGVTTLARAAAKRLANTPTVARKSYIHPDVMALVGQPPLRLSRPRAGLSQTESAMLRLLEG